MKRQSLRKSSKPKGDPVSSGGRAPKKNDYGVDQRWSPVLAKDGFVPVVNYFLENYHALKPYSLTHGEAMFVIHLMSFKWNSKAPYPGYRKIAERMGVSDKTARRLAKSLEDKKYLEREVQVAQTNRFHLEKLIRALEVHQASRKKGK